MNYNELIEKERIITARQVYIEFIKRFKFDEGANADLNDIKQMFNI